MVHQVWMREAVQPENAEAVGRNIFPYRCPRETPSTAIRTWHGSSAERKIKSLDLKKTGMCLFGERRLV